MNIPSSDPVVLTPRGSTGIQGTALILHMRGCSDAGPARRLLRPNPSRPHGRDTRACGRRVGGSSWQRARPERLHPFVRCSTAAPTNVCKVWSSSKDLLFVLALLPVARSSTSRRVVVSVSDSFVELCGCATPHHMRCGTASSAAHHVACAGQLKPERPSSASSMPLSV